MEAPSYGKRLIVPLVGAAVAVLIILAVHSVRQFFSLAPEAAAALKEVPAKKLPPSLFFPSLYCAFNRRHARRHAEVRCRSEPSLALCP